ncbi:membrane protease YdiL (CAAX protease family) [Nocardia sp. GAS34]|uniref:CPBP family intramembrane glutamic endopeptidase n=1 Tax=unclassified Nocardia TaxID=2637762 RepID=UPI003D244DA6
MVNTTTAAKQRTTVPWPEISFFLVLTFGGAWLTALPLWIGGVSVSGPWFLLVSIGTMLVPAIATAVTAWIWRPPQGIARSTGLVLPRPARRLWGFGALGFGYPVVVALVALPLGLLTGVAYLDVSGLSGLRQLARDQFGLAGGAAPGSLLLSAVGMTAALFVFGLLPCFGEEWGWRGYLIPKLLPLGIWPALLIDGVLWAVWHAPLLLRGFNYGSTDVAGIAEMIVSCVLAAIVLGWLDLRSGSAWPAVIAHSSNNTFAVLITTGLAVDTAHPVDRLLTQIPVWVATALLVFVLHRRGQLSVPTGRVNPPNGAGIPQTIPRTGRRHR